MKPNVLSALILSFLMFSPSAFAGDFCTSLTSINQLNVFGGTPIRTAVIGRNDLNPNYTYGVMFPASDPLANTCQDFAVAKAAREKIGNAHIPTLEICGSGTLTVLKSGGINHVSVIASKLSQCRLYNSDENI